MNDYYLKNLDAYNIQCEDEGMSIIHDEYEEDIPHVEHHWQVFFQRVLPLVSNKDITNVVMIDEPILDKAWQYLRLIAEGTGAPRIMCKFNKVWTRPVSPIAYPSINGIDISRLPSPKMESSAWLLKGIQYLDVLIIDRERFCTRVDLRPYGAKSLKPVKTKDSDFNLWDHHGGATNIVNKTYNYKKTKLTKSFIHPSGRRR